MKKEFLLLGDEALAQGALDAGLSGVYAYPGTPSTEITEYIQRSPDAKEVHSLWSTNEKTAMEEGLGMSYAGKRAMVCMKHVGLNVAADAFINSAITGSNGGLIVAVADDPSMHSSQNEQDSRYYGKFAMLPTLEPANQQQAYDMAFYGFELSEKLNLPVLIRLTTRVAHSRAVVKTKEKREENFLSLPSNPTQFVLIPALARGKYKGLIDKQSGIKELAEASPYNQLKLEGDRALGVIACGIANNYFEESCKYIDKDFPILKIGQYPMPIHMIKAMVDHCEEILVLEDGYPFVEEVLANPIYQTKKIHGRLDGTVPRTGELNTMIVSKALGYEWDVKNKVPEWLANRPPSMCAGCTHIEVFNELNAAMKPYGQGKVFSDIGCYTLGVLSPYNAINSCVDMGASITMAKGAADAGLRPAVAVIGDSTFTHSGMTGLLDAISENSPITVIISDNSTTAMTGGQASLGTGHLDAICIGLGADPAHVHTFEPSRKNREETIELINRELQHEGLSIIIPHRECVQTARKSKAKRKLEKQVL
jgi:indolepyruvate ferredoxin oxidoreductase alpha subunit